MTLADFITPEGITLIVASYFLGCFSSAYYLTKFRLGEDIRDLGSSNAGAKNAGRALGKMGFALVFLGDFLKGALVLGIARYLGLSDLECVLVLIAVIAGHIFPVQLGFKGGKGLATTLAGLLVIDYRLTLILLALTGLLTVLSKNDHISVTFVISISPIIAFALGLSIPIIVGLSPIAGLIIFSHRHDLRKTLKAKSV